MTKYVDIKGKSLWAKVWPSQIDRDFEDEFKGGNNSVSLILGDDQLKLFNALGSKAKAKRVEDLKKTDGLEDFLDAKFVTFRRYERLRNGSVVSPLKVIGVDPGTLIGNLSDLTCTVEVYETEFKSKPIIGMRLLQVRVDVLVPYTKTTIEVAQENAQDAPPVH
jgi:hypothetical protein